MGTAIKHPVELCSVLRISVPRFQRLCLNLVWLRMLYSCTHMATVGVKGLIEVLCEARSWLE